MSRLKRKGLAAESSLVVLSSCSLSELPSDDCKNEWFCSPQVYGYSHCAQGTSVCSHATIMLASQIW